MKPDLFSFPKIYLPLFILAITTRISAQTTISSTQAGPWTTGTTWSGGTSPGTTSLSNHVSISHNISLSADLGQSGSNSIIVTINSGGTLTLSQASATIQGNSSSKTLTIIVASGGTLKLTGTGTHTFKSFAYVTVQSGGTVNMSGTADFINDGFLTVQSGATSVSFSTLQIDYNGTGGTTYTATINSGATISASALNIGNNGKAILSNSGTINVNGNVDSNGVIKNNDTGVMNVTGTFTQENSGNSTTSSGTINVTGSAYAYGLIQLNPGASANSEMIVGALTVTANPWIVVGTNVSACGSSIPYYADLVVKGDVTLSGSGDVTVNQNGRFVVFGNINGASSSGTLFTINCGGQAYVNGNVNLGSGGGNTVQNNNSSSSPIGTDGAHVIGLYVNGSTTAQNVNGTEGTKSQMQSNDLPFYNYVAGLAGSPLPIKLTYFGGEKETDEIILLKWTTSTEINFDHFEIQKSTDGEVFNKIGEVKGHGTTNQSHEYEFEDIHPIVGKNYYRLKSFDFDGYMEIFHTIAVSYELPRKISVYPNPLNQQNLHVDLNFETADATRIVVTDIEGDEKISWSTTDFQNSIPVNLPPGIYVITVSNGEEKKVSRLVIN